MIHSADEFVTLRTAEDPENYNRAVYDSAPDEVWIEVIEKYPDMKVWVVRNKTIAEHILAMLAKDKDSSVREAVARKRKASVELLEELAVDPHESVRLAVATNKSTPLSILSKLLKDEWKPVAETAQERITIASELH